MGNFLKSKSTMEEYTFVQSQPVCDNDEYVSNSQDTESNDIQEQTVDMGEQSNNIQEQSNDIQGQSNDIQGQSNDIQKQPFVHPLFELLDRNPNEQDLIENMNAFCGPTFVGVSETGEPIYEIVDQLDSIYPMIKVLFYSVKNNYKDAVIWILKNYLPIQVSHSDNYLFKLAIHKNNMAIAELLLTHPSFEPSVQILKFLLENNYFELIRKCLDSPNLPKIIAFYKNTIINHLDNSNRENIRKVLNNIEERLEQN
jgi:hypothetical protein